MLKYLYTTVTILLITNVATHENDVKDILNIQNDNIRENNDKNKDKKINESKFDKTNNTLDIQNHKTDDKIHKANSIHNEKKHEIIITDKTTHTNVSSKSNKNNHSSELTSPSSQSEVFLTLNTRIENLITYKAMFDPDWSKQNSYSASSISEWKKWWNYFSIKTPTTTNWYGNLSVKTYPGNEVCRSIHVKGTYDPNRLALIDLLLPKGGVFIDIGANIGHYTLYAVKACGATGKIIAIEPSSRDFSRLKENVELNKLDEVISTINIGILDEDGEKELLISDEERGCLNTFGHDFSCKGIQSEGKEQVKVCKLDTFLKDKFLHTVHLINIDIEGSELKALHGAKNTIEKYRPALLLGVNNNAFKANKVEHQQVVEFLQQINYKLYTIDFNQNKLVEILDGKELLKENLNMVLGLHSSFLPPELTFIEKKSFLTKLKRFFTEIN